MAIIDRNDVLRVTGIPSQADGGPLTDADIDTHVVFAEAIAEKYLATSLQPGGTSKTLTLDGSGVDTLFLPYMPIRSITSLTIDGTSVTPSNVWLYGDEGYLRLKTTAEVTKFKNNSYQQIVLTFVYGREPTEVDKLFVATIAGIHALVQQVGGTFDDVTSYSIPEFTASKGEPWTQIRETLQRLLNQLESYKQLLRPVPIIV